MFLDAVGGHKRCRTHDDPSHFVLQQLDYLKFIDIYHSRIAAFRVKNAAFNPTARQRAYSGYQPWMNRAARFSSRWKVPGVLDWSTGIYNPQVDIGHETTTLYASDRDVFLFLVDNKNPIEAGRLSGGSRPECRSRNWRLILPAALCCKA